MPLKKLNHVPSVDDGYMSPTSKFMSTTNCYQETIYITLEGRELPSKDTFSQSDGFAVVSQRNRDDRDSDYVEIGRTKVIKNNKNPRWTETIGINYNVGDLQELKFVVYDSDSDSKNLSKHDKIMEVGALVSEFLACKQGEFVLKEGKSSLIVRYSHATSKDDTLQMTVSCEKLARTDLFGKGDPYFVIDGKMDNGDGYMEFYKSEVMRNNNAPKWLIDLPLKVLCNGITEAPVRVSVYDWDKNGPHDLIGRCEVTFDDLVRDRRTSLELKHQTKKARGTITFDQVVRTHVKSAADYLKEGLEYQVILGVDFTSSNGDPQQSSSLHYLHTEENHYQEAIRRIGEVLEPYDSNRMMPVYGFGGQPQSESDVNHCFTVPSNMKLSSNGVKQALIDYKTLLNSVYLSGPTVLAPLLSHAMGLAESARNTKQYIVLVIVTDGVICDMENVRKLLITAQQLPLSIIIVGVGNANFTDMYTLDGDKKALTDSRGFKGRDIVNFVEMNKLRQKGKASLAVAALGELPSQVASYYKTHGKHVFK